MEDPEQEEEEKVVGLCWVAVRRLHSSARRHHARCVRRCPLDRLLLRLLHHLLPAGLCGMRGLESAGGGGGDGGGCAGGRGSEHVSHGPFCGCTRGLIPRCTRGRGRKKRNAPNTAHPCDAKSRHMCHWCGTREVAMSEHI